MVDELLSTAEAPADTSVAAAPKPPLGARFLTVWAGQSLSSLGSMLGRFGIAVWVFIETGSAAWLGVLIALAGLPTLLMAPLVRLVDRSSRRSVMIWGDVVASVGTIVSLVLAATGRLEVWHLAAAGFLAGAGSAFQAPAFQAAIPSLVPPEAIPRANGLNQFGPALAFVAGPALGTPIVAAWGLEAVLLIDVATFAVAVVTTWLVRFDDPVLDDAAGEADDGSWQAAFAFLRGPGRPLALLIATLVSVNLFLSGFNVALVAAAIEIGGASRSGLVLASGGVAMLVGSLVLGSRGLPTQRIRAFAVALVGVAAGCWIAASRPSLAAVMIGTVVALAAVPAVNASVATIFHERVPAGMQGRVFGLRFALGNSLGPAGSLATGFVIARFAVPTMSDGIGAHTLGRLVGTGADRGTALVLIAVGAAVLGVATGVARSTIRRELDGL